MVAGGDDDGRERAQPRERVPEQPHARHARHRAVVDVARDEHDVDVPLAHDIDEVVEERGVMLVQVLAVEGAPEVPVARVADAHAGPSSGRAAVPVTLPEGADTASPHLRINSADIR